MNSSTVIDKKGSHRGVSPIYTRTTHRFTILEAAPFTICPTIGYDGGLGCYANRDIAIGEAILEEAPLIEVRDSNPEDPDECSQAQDYLSFLLDRMSDTQRDTFFQAHDCHSPDMPTPDGIMRSNAYPTEYGKGALFPIFARLNHCCTPNVTHYWDRIRRVRVVFAARKIARGEEVFNSYVRPAQKRSTRWLGLSSFNFVCGCAACLTAEGDARRERIAEIDYDIFLANKCNDTKGAAELVTEMLSLLTEERLDTPEALMRLYYDGNQIWKELDPAVARGWLDRAEDATQRCRPWWCKEVKSIRTKREGGGTLNLTDEDLGNDTGGCAQS